MKKLRLKRILAAILCALMAFAMAACGNNDKDPAEGDSSGNASNGSDSLLADREGYYLETLYEMPSDIYTVVSPYMRPDGVVEFLGQSYGDPESTMTMTVSAGEEASADSTPPAPASEEGIPEGSEEGGGAQAEAPGVTESMENPEAFTMPEANYTLYEWDMSSKSWTEADASWMDGIKGEISQILAMTVSDAGDRYVIANGQFATENNYDENGYTPPPLLLYKIAADGTVSTIDMDWHVANRDYSSAAEGMEAELTVVPATFERVEYNYDSYRYSSPTAAEDTDDSEAADEAAVATETGADTGAEEALAAEEESTTEDKSEDDDEESGTLGSVYSSPMSTAPSPSSISVLDNGDMLIGDYTATLIYDAQGQYTDYLETENYGMGSQYALDGNNMYALGNNNESSMGYSVLINQYDLSSTDRGAPVASFPAPPSSQNYAYTAQMAISDGALYWLDQTGLFSYDMSAGETGEWKELAGPELLYVSDPDANMQGLQTDGQGNFYTMLSEYGSNSVQYNFLGISYTDDAPMEITAEISVYSLTDNYQLRRYVNDFRKQNPSVLVDIQYGMDYTGSVTAQDVINSLNKLLLAEKGPDVFLLDGLPIDSYIEKGVLMDLSEWAAPKLAQGIWMDGLARAYEDESGAIYALPTSMQIPLLMGDQTALEGFNSLSDFADYVSTHDDAPALYDTTPMGLIRPCFLMVSDQVIDEDGSFNEAALAQFLEDVKKISDTDKGAPLSQEMYDMFEQYASEGWEYDFSSTFSGDGALQYAFGDCNFSIVSLYGSDYWRMMKAAQGKREGSGVSLLPADGAYVFEPMSIIGINNRTEHQEECLALLDVMTAAKDPEAVNYGYGIPLVMDNMYPVELTEEEIAASGSMAMASTWGYGDEKGRMLMVEGNVTREDVDEIIAFLQPLDTPLNIDSQLLKMIYDNSRDFFDGKESAEDAAAKIVEASRIYMSE